MMNMLSYEEIERIMQSLKEQYPYFLSPKENLSFWAEFGQEVWRTYLNSKQNNVSNT